ncbi:MAG: LytR C-terminal domain-containing protein [Rhodothermales bacterium]
MARSEGGGRSSVILNLSLVVLGVFVVVLLYGLSTRYLTPRSDSHRATDAPTHLIGSIIQVEIRNACGVANLASDTRRYLRAHGFDVVEVGDHSTHDLERSMVIDRSGDLRAARKVARALGLPEDRIVQEIKEEFYLDASVLLGKDYASLRPFQ